MIKMEYFVLPIKTLSFDLIYKLSGDVETPWRIGKISMITIGRSRRGQGDMLRDFARSQAAIMEYNQYNKSGGEIDLYKDVPVELVKYVSDTDRTPPVPMVDQIKKGELIVEYVHLPVRDTNYHYVMRFVSPIPTAWQYNYDDPAVRDCQVREDGGIREFLVHVSLETLVGRMAKTSWLDIKEQSSEIVGPTGNLDEFDIDNVTVKECKLIKGVENEEDFSIASRR